MKVIAASGGGGAATGGVSFMEDYTYHLVKGQETILGAHMLEICPSIADGKPSLEIHPLSIGGKNDPCRLVFNAAPGPSVAASIVDMGGRMRMVVQELDAVKAEHAMPKLPVARAVWEPEPSLATSAECWIAAGGPHHTVLSQGVGTEEIADFAELIGVELLIIDRDTRPRRFAQEIRWNQAYHRLAIGF
jgi:L-arabinose isomerase